MNETSNYHLNQWAKSDQVRMEDFNADNAKIDAAISGVAASTPRIYIGRYTGGGVWGQEHPNTIVFPFPPKLVIVAMENGTADTAGNVFIRGQTASAGIGYTSGSAPDAHLALTWEGNTLSWYTTESNPQGIARQLNVKNAQYLYLVIG